MKVLFIVALVATGVAGCSQNEPAKLGVPIVEHCAAEPEAQYFPVGAFTSPNWNDADLFVRRWYSTYLAAMEEPSLYCGAPDDTETYRFVWLPTWDNPVSVRISRHGDDYGLNAVILSGSGGFEVGEPVRRVSTRLTRAQWRYALASLNESEFWQTTTDTDDIIGNDGAQWIIEARREGKYHFVDRWSQAEGVEKVQAVGRVFLDLAGLQEVRPGY